MLRIVGAIVQFNSQRTGGIVAWLHSHELKAAQSVVATVMETKCRWRQRDVLPEIANGSKSPPTIKAKYGVHLTIRHKRPIVKFPRAMD